MAQQNKLYMHTTLYTANSPRYLQTHHMKQMENLLRRCGIENEKPMSFSCAVAERRLHFFFIRTYNFYRKLYTFSPTILHKSFQSIREFADRKCEKTQIVFGVFSYKIIFHFPGVCVYIKNCGKENFI